MIDAYEIGIRLALGDGIFSALERLSGDFTKIDGVVKSIRTNLDSMTADMGQLTRAAASVAEAWSSAAAAMKSAAASMAASGAGSGGGGPRLLLPMPPAGGPGLGGGGRSPIALSAGGGAPLLLPAPGGGGGGGGILPPTPPAAPVPPGGGGGGGLLSGLGPIAEEAATFLAVRSSLQEDIALRQSLLSMGFQAGTEEFTKAIGQLRSLAAAGSGGTIYSEAQAAQAMPSAAGVLGFGGDIPAARADAMRKFGAIFPTALRLGEVAEMQHMGTLTDSIVAAIGYAHMTDRYDPGKLEPGLDRLLNIARLTHESVSGEASVLKYSVPIGMASGMKPDDVAALTGFLQIMGFSGSTAGTGLGQLITGLKPSAIQRMDSEHAKSMRALGVLTEGGTLAPDVAPGGKLDAMALMRHVAEYAQTHRPMDVLQTLRNAFTVRGMRVAGVLENTDVLPRLENYEAQLDRLPGARASQEALAQSPLQQFEQVLARGNDVLNTLVTGTLPGLKVAFETLQQTLGRFNEFLKDHPTAATAGGYGLEGLGLGFLVASGQGLWRIAQRFVGRTPLATAGSGLLRTAGGLGLAFGGAGAIASGIDAISEWIEGKLFGDARLKEVQRLHEQGAQQFHRWFALGPAEAATTTPNPGLPNPPLSGPDQQGPTPPAGTVPPDPNHWGRPGPNEPLKAEISSESADRLTAMIAAAVRSGLAGVGIYIDGRELGSLVTQHQANEANRPPTTTSVPDIRLDPSYAMPGFAPGL